eukprot:gene41590-39291_t
MPTRGCDGRAREDPEGQRAWISQRQDQNANPRDVVPSKERAGFAEWQQGFASDPDDTRRTQASPNARAMGASLRRTAPPGALGG